MSGIPHLPAPHSISGRPKWLQICLCFSGKRCQANRDTCSTGSGEVRAFWKQFKALDPPPQLKSFDDITIWWLNHPNPLTYQMALNLPDDLYRHFLTHMILEDEEVYRLAEKGLVTENEYLDIRLWYHNGPFRDHWLGPLGVDGTGYLYGLTRHYRKPKCL